MNRLNVIAQGAGAPRPGVERFVSALTMRQVRYFVAVAETGKVSAAEFHLVHEVGEGAPLRILRQGLERRNSRCAEIADIERTNEIA